MPKAVFVYPYIDYLFSRTPYMPLGIGYLIAGIVQKSVLDWSFELVDGNLFSTEEDFFKSLSEKKADVYLISATLRQVSALSQIVSIIRDSNHKAKIILGGPGPSSLYYAGIDYDYSGVDLIVYGEAEDIIGAVLDQVFGSSQKNSGIDTAINVVGKYPLAFIPTNKPRLNIPDRSIFDVGAYMANWKKSTGMTSLHLLGSRGCPFNCSFCDKSVSGYDVRYLQDESLKSELSLLTNKYRPDDVFFFDDLLTISDDRVVHVCNLVNSLGVNFKWSCQGRVNTFTPKMGEVLALSGCTEIYFGVESGSEKILGIMNKRITSKQVIEAFKYAREAGLKVGAYFIVGVPGEDVEDLQATLTLIDRIKPDLLNVSVLTPFPNTSLFRSTRRLIEHYDFSRWDDFRTTVYKPEIFPIHPEESLRVINNHYKQMISKGVIANLCDYQNI